MYGRKSGGPRLEPALTWHNETSRISCNHVNFPEMNVGDKCIWGTKLYKNTKCCNFLKICQKLRF